MVSRREFLGVTVGAGASLALAPELLRALRQPGGTLIQRAIPSSGEKIPVVGLSFSNHALCADPAALKEVLKTFADRGGRVFDAMHGNAQAEQFHAAVANELGVQNKLFWSTRGTPPAGPSGPAQPGPAAARERVEAVLARLGAPRLDLAMVSVAGDPAWRGALKEMKQEGRIRHVGVQTIVAKFQSAQLEAVMRNEPVDFIGVDYDVSNRHVEDVILPLARERKIGVMAFFPLGNNGGVSCGSGRNLFARVGRRPVPEWAAEFDARTWAQFFLKYVISHPASPWRGWGRPRRTTWSTTSAAASAACPTRRRGGAWRRSSTRSPRLRRRDRKHLRERRHRGSRCRRPSWTATSVSTRRRPDSPWPSDATGRRCS
jgi:aryl-alcohol dehydrogenase-like predicted oxidoreductase